MNGLLLIPSTGMDSNIYIIGEEDLTIIDTGTGATIKSILKKIEKNGLKTDKIRKILLSHTHIDHSGGLAELYERFNPEVYVHKNEASWIETGEIKKTLASWVNGVLKPVPVSHKLEEGAKLSFGRFNFDVLHTPGHSCGSICLYEKDKKILISGDTVFSNGNIGRFDLPTGSFKDLLNSIERLTQLDVNILLPGHMKPVMTNGSKHIQSSFKHASSFVRF